MVIGLVLWDIILTCCIYPKHKDFTLALKLTRNGGASLQWGPSFVAGPSNGGDDAAVFFGTLLRGPSVRLQELVLDPTVAPLHPSGSQVVISLSAQMTAC